ncbi:related to glycinamide ribonucleotide transformylase [Sporisorium reilianum SRZ2]|uniref:phosphoribosylglycinamide formyltransferase 1 n=1 Tax=Sporisorium reilianum (strain SRZ2) TaxID=999809 RepID=E6ZKM5_SPORE|nr:related to glycinamide ribonucleotide transformylase [Sporisorium reilianum SRZ2]
MSFPHHQPFPRQSAEATSPSSDSPTQDLASWVNQVRQRNSSSAASSRLGQTSSQSHEATPSSASELELEFQRQRLERQQRRDRLSVSGIRGISSSNPNSPLATPSLESPPPVAAEYSGHFASTMTPPDASSQSPLLGSSPTKASGVTGIKRANSLLARYGGQYGPTGVAAGPMGPNDSPVSLANFMGGRAAGPRLGKLAGDGKSAPPEAELIHESRRVPLPGMAPNSGRSLASFLEERADAAGNRRPTSSGSPASPVKENTLATSPGKASSPAKYSFTSAELGRPSNSVGSTGAFASPAPPSPKKAYLDLIEKQNVSAAPTSSAPGSPAIPRASSPSKFHRFAAGAESTTTSPLIGRPASPVKGTSATPSLPIDTAGGLTSDVRASRPLPIPNAQSKSHSSSDSPERKDAATSPFKPEEIQIASAVPAAQTQSKPETGLGRGWSRPTEQADAPASQVSSRSTSLANSELAGADRIPTASLSRLSAKKMVGQRIKEAQMRDVNAQKEVESMQVGSAGRSVPSSPAVRDRWPPAIQTHASPVRSGSDERKSGTPWSPTKYGNALPGLAGRSPTKETGSSPWQSSSPKKHEIVAEPRAEPIRLPGMGGSVSPFARFADNRSRTEEAIVVPDSTTPAIAASNTDQVLTSLTKARAKGSVRKAATADAKLAPSSASSSAPAAPETAKPAAHQTEDKTSSAAPSKPPRRTTGKRVHVLVSGSGSNLQSLIDATLLDPPAGIPVIDNAQITFVLSNRKAAYGLTRAAESNPPIPTKVLALKTWQNRNPGGTREEYDRVLARAVLDGPHPEGTGTPPDLIVLAGFMRIVSEPFLHALGHKTSLPANTPTIGARPSKAVPIINLHPALPKAFDGANAIPRAFEAYKQGLTDKTGCMVHEVVADVDRGRPIIVREVPILPSYDLEQLEQAIHKVEHVIIVQAADLVLKGHLDELDRQEAESQKAKTTNTAPAIKRSPSDLVQLKSSDGDVAGTAATIVRDARISLNKLAGLSKVAPSSPTKTVSVEVLAIDADGFVESLELSGDQTFQRGEQLRREQILYDDETLAIVAKLKSESGVTQTKLWVRTGHSSALHPFELGPYSTSCAEGRKLAELAQRYSAQPEVIPAGCESHELIAALSGTWAVSRQGSRKRFDGAAAALYRVRRAVASASGQEQRFAIQQVESRTSDLCSADSFVSCALSTIRVWHGRGSPASVRAAAVRFAQALAKSASTGARTALDIVEVEEGAEDSSFWKVFDKTEAYASAWSHRHHELALSDDSSLLDVEVQGRELRLVLLSEKGYYGAHDLLLPTRSSKISILTLRDRELYVIVGQDARSDRLKLACAIAAAEELARQLQDTLRASVSSLATVVPRPAVHVVVLPSKLPCEVRAASHVWSDQVVDYLQADAASRMNVHSSTSALQQLAQRSWPRWALLDADHLPVGVGADDVKNALA